VWSAVKAGAAYFALVFLVGFALGVVRVGLLIPRVGTFWAVLCELPVILTASWFVCGWVLRRFAVPAQAGHRIAMGAVAFVLLITAEVLLATAFGQSPSAYLAKFETPEGALGLAGQVVFGLFPWLRLRTGT
jgi:hypothetical protein